MLARFIRAAFQKHTPFFDRGVRKGAFRIIHETHIPSVLVECCFLSNQKNLAWISTEEGKAKVAQCIAQGVLTYYSRHRKI